MKVIFCRVHKEYFETKVKGKLCDGKIGIQPNNLVTLIRLSENCNDCEWKTLFGDEE